MTQLTRTQPRSTTGIVAAVALAAALVGGLVGGGAQALLAGSPTHGPIVSPRDAVVLQAAIAWEARYRQMHPESR
jgi:hypothetical protein